MSPLAEKTALTSRLGSWLLNDSSLYGNPAEYARIDPFRLAIFLFLHLGILGVYFTGTSMVAVLICLMLYFARMFFITAFYHRYFSHRTYKVSRMMQLLIAIAGCTAGQRGPLWWASHHRHHHLTSDKFDDPHSPQNGLLESHMLWFLKKGNFAIRTNRINDLMSFRELRMLDSVHWLPFIMLAVICYFTGTILNELFPTLGTSGPQILVWGFFISTVCLYHGTYTINSIAHKFGSRRYNTNDNSRNNVLLALLTLGEGWHNNHHRYPASTRQGFFWWEIDISFMLLRLFAMVGLVRDMKPVPLAVMLDAKGIKR